MTTLRQAAQQTLGALEGELPGWLTPAQARAIIALRAALAQEEQEPGQAEREKLAHWMRSMGYATGHGDTIEDLLDHLGTQISEGLKVEVLMEREACAKECDGIGDSNKWSDAHDCAAAIRARSNT